MADVAQSVEQHIRNVRVVCSIHIIGSKNIKGLRGFPGGPFLLGHIVKNLGPL